MYKKIFTTMIGILLIGIISSCKTVPKAEAELASRLKVAQVIKDALLIVDLRGMGITCYRFIEPNTYTWLPCEQFNGYDLSKMRIVTIDPLGNIQHFKQKQPK